MSLKPLPDNNHLSKQYTALDRIYQDKLEQYSESITKHSEIEEELYCLIMKRQALEYELTHAVQQQEQHEAELSQLLAEMQTLEEQIFGEKGRWVL